MLLSVALIADQTAKAQASAAELSALYKFTSPAEAEILLCLGGDGFMLRTLHKYEEAHKPFYGMNCGSVGFLMNRYDPQGLENRLKTAHKIILHPLEMLAHTAQGVTRSLAINEVSLWRHSSQAAKIRVSVDGVERLPELVCDGVLVSTPAGSTAYNLSAHGPILPLGSQLLALTPISAFRPRRWRGALLPAHARVSFHILEGEKRPVNAVADDTEVRFVTQVDIRQDTTTSHTLLFDPDHNLEDRILSEQFLA